MNMPAMRTTSACHALRGTVTRGFPVAAVASVIGAALQADGQRDRRALRGPPFSDTHRAATAAWARPHARRAGGLKIELRLAE
ncbi:hypothetical protein CXY01_34650 [Cellulomonas xylanilytica]|uniref:Uncharacterized protein n=1 Tax=Cellulomonas xylanilytica TaxID=233583 RepID=A0A510VCR1_9CELL|nr:hypothetical protein CXY01_34650 [Cellulomonas xylanilytica]